MRVLLATLLWIAIATSIACDRNIEPVVPGEQPSKPDLARIFPDPGDAPLPTPVVPAQPPSAAEMAAAPAMGTPISGTIRVSPELVSAVPPGAILFLVARASGSRGGPPLAVQRLAPSGFPLAFSIGPQDVMIPSMRFEGQLDLTARIDSDGNAITRQPGDLQSSASGTVAPGATGVEILINEKL